MSQKFDSVWDAIEDTPEKAHKMKLLSSMKMRFSRGYSIEDLISQIPDDFELTEEDLQWVQAQPVGREIVEDLKRKPSVKLQNALDEIRSGKAKSFSSVDEVRKYLEL